MTKPKTLRLILGDQLTRGLSALSDIDPVRDVVLMVEVAAETTYVPHHKQKIAFILSAMRHFAQDLRAEGVTVDYVALDDPDNTHSFGGELVRALSRHAPDRVVVTEPGEWRVWAMMQDWGTGLPTPLDIRPDDRFFCSRADFARLAAARKTGRMEFFYRELRRQTGLLMDDGAPAGGQWNYDPENRKPLPAGFRAPKRLRFAPDAITRDVMALVQTRHPDTFGDLEPFGWAVTRADALAALDHFLTDCLPNFGDFQDAMKTGEDFLMHSLISPYLNAGLLTPREVCVGAEAAYRDGHAPLNAVEGFIRQILGWREYVRGIYWADMPGYAQTNHLNAARDLPAFYWTGQTRMHCMAECIRGTRQNAYAHHIQRLMVTGNFALLAGVDPAQVHEWYLSVYIDAFEWVEAPNTLGMSQFADGGLLGAKPYVSSGAYIDRMSDHCGGCHYRVKEKTGPGACPFNLMYWHFLTRHRDRFKVNPRMGQMYRVWDGMDEGHREKVLEGAEALLARLEAGEVV